MRSTWIRHFAFVGALALVADPSAVHAQKKSRDVITREEILKSAPKDGDLYTAIKALRPHMVEAPRGTRSMGGTYTSPIAVYIDKIRQPSGDVLQQMLATDVAEVRYLEPNRSQNEFGITANGGAIIVKKYVQVGLADSLNARKPPR